MNITFVASDQQYASRTNLTENSGHRLSNLNIYSSICQNGIFAVNEIGNFLFMGTQYLNFVVIQNGNLISRTGLFQRLLLISRGHYLVKHSVCCGHGLQ